MTTHDRAQSFQAPYTVEFCEAREHVREAIQAAADRLPPGTLLRDVDPRYFVAAATNAIGRYFAEWAS
jgi:hypothetical protein